ncbi:hypothetical protein Q0601_00945 [Paracoccus onubensis]|uniref:hypothetical protein n=1 Tax=Paracoccus onubensis TaxID=1675788 RepID=UPI002730B825|nr:hypothetical protein [Paracoccus onubensis]MDP0925729.1 hypothetical protein [Paracoccus onubensis]
MTPEQQAALDAMEQYGSQRKAAEALGISRAGLRSRLDGARKHVDPGPAVTEAAEKIGLNMAVIKGGWVTPRGLSARFSIPDTDGYQEVLEEIRESIEELMNGKRPSLPDRFESREGSMLFVSPADVHIGKLSVQTETGVTYNSDIAAHRLAEGCRSIIRRSKGMSCSRVALVIGNDISHIDRPDRRTTSGTPQDTCGTIFTIHKAAFKGYVDAINHARAEGLEVHLYFVPSNHDWVLGYTIAQAVWAYFHDHPNVHANEYTMSENHRKYIRFGGNNIGITHGDGAKESDLPQLMMRETGHHAAETLHHYWYIHHYHHKIKKNAGLNPQSREKDHIAMTAINIGIGAMEGDNTAIEVIRSPSAPDGWHHRNGYLNRQAVEAFVHHARDGQTDRLTEWF